MITSGNYADPVPRETVYVLILLHFSVLHTQLWWPTTQCSPDTHPATDGH